MDKKLTLSLNAKVIEEAKIYAKKNRISLSRLIETYLSSIVGKSEQEETITPLVESLSGVIQLPEDYDSKEEYTNYLLEKYQ